MIDESKLAKLKESVDEYAEAVKRNEVADRLSKYETPVFELAVELFYGEELWKILKARV